MNDFQKKLAFHKLLIVDIKLIILGKEISLLDSISGSSSDPFSISNVQTFSGSNPILSLFNQCTSYKKLQMHKKILQRTYMVHYTHTFTSHYVCRQFLSQQLFCMIFSLAESLAVIATIVFIFIAKSFETTKGSIV